MPGELRWAVRSSLLRYITLIALGTSDLSDEVKVDENGVFTFPLIGMVTEGEDRRLSFAGSLHLLAHHGLLDIRITNPEVIIGPERGVIVARIGADTQTISPIVATEGAVPRTIGGALVWSDVATTLLDEAVPLFGAVYPEGTDMAPFAMRVVLGS